MAYVELLLENKQFLGGLRDAQGRLKSAGQIFSQVGQAASRAGAYVATAGAAMLAPFVLAVRQFMATGDALDEMSARVGTSVEFLSALGYAAELGGMSMESMEGSIRRLQRSAYDAAQGSKAAADAYAELGVSVTGADGKLRGTEELFMETVAALSAIENETQKAALATVLFGRAGTQLLPMLSQGKEGLQALMEEARRLGLVMSTEDAKAAGLLDDAWTKLTNSLKRASIQIGAALAPTLTGLADELTAVVTPVLSWIRSNGQLVQTIAAVAAGMVVLGGALKVVGMAMTAIAAHPMTAAILAAASAIAVYTMELKKVADAQEKFYTIARRQLEVGDQQRATTIALFSELETLAQKTSLNNEQQARAQAIIGQLNTLYGDLGIRLDATTGKLTGVADAQSKANEMMTAMAATQVQSALAESMERAAKAQDRIAKGTDVSKMLSVAMGMAPDEVAAAEKRLAEETALQTELQKRLDDIQGGSKKALTDGAGAPAGDPAVEAARATDDEIKKDLEMVHRHQQIRLGMIEDEHARALALIEEKYDHEIAMARAAGEEIDGLEEARALEIAAANQKHHQDLAAEKKKALEEESKKNQAEAERQAQDRQRLEDEVLRLQIENSDETDAAKERALLDLAHRREQEEAIQAGVDLELVRQKQELEVQSLDRRQQAAAGLAAAEQQIGTSGTFSSFAAARMGGASSAAERTARATETQVDLLRSIDRKTVPQPAFT